MTAVEARPSESGTQMRIDLDQAPLPHSSVARRRRPQLPMAAVVISRAGIGAAVLAVWCLFFALALGSLSMARHQELLYEQMRVHLADETQPIGGLIDPGTPVALIEAPAIDLRYVVVEGTTSGDLRAGPGHRRDTPLPGQAGTSVLYGRANAFGGPFQRITELRRGDTIAVTTGQGTFDYRVDDVRHAGDPDPQRLATGAGRLTLVTAEGVSWRAGWAPNRVVYVDASLQGAPQPAPAGRLLRITNPEKALAGDPGELEPLVLWLQALLLGGMGAGWAAARWGGPQAWLVGAPVILAALWGASESALALLPNLM